ncbi:MULTISPECIES: hypothetical protein [Burkholderia]|uniref:hypothetical protein n=1 Tax=Burkholderia TaxID=32008 RepID=UPI0012F481CB|nr:MULTISPECIES: hypothetical protein [Burkholderia]
MSSANRKNLYATYVHGQNSQLFDYDYMIKISSYIHSSSRTFAFLGVSLSDVSIYVTVKPDTRNGVPLHLLNVALTGCTVIVQIENAAFEFDLDRISGNFVRNHPRLPTQIFVWLHTTPE